MLPGITCVSRQRRSPSSNCGRRARLRALIAGHERPDGTPTYTGTKVGMRILYFHQHFSTPKGSTGIRSYEVARTLIRRGHSVAMVCGAYKGGHTGLGGAFTKGVR